MSVFSQILDLVGQISNTFSEPGISKKGKRGINRQSILSNKPTDDTTDSSSPLINFFGQNTKSTREELRNFHLTKAIVDLYSSTIMDSVNSSSLKISNARDDNKINDKVIEDVNYFLDLIDIKTFIRQNIADFLYFGKFALIFKVNRKEKSYVFDIPKNPFDFHLVECKDEDYILIRNKTGEYVQRNKSNFVCYFNEKKRVDYINEIEVDHDEIEGSSNRPTDDYDYLEDLVNPIVYYGSEGLLDDNLNLLLSIFLNELLLDNLSLRDATRKDIIIADVKDPKTPGQEVANAMDEFNETFNNNFLYNASINNLSAMANILMQNVIYEGTAVLPGHENYTNFDMLDIPDLSKKKEDLADLQISQRNKLFTNKGIPEGIFEGTGNKWDTLQDQTRFLTEVSKYNDSVIEFITQIAVKYINEAYDLDITPADINLELGVSNTITNSKWNRDIGLQAKMLSEVSSILRTARDDTDVENLYIDSTKYLEMVNSSLAVVNPSLENLILIDKTVRPSNEREDECELEENSDSDNQSGDKYREVMEEQESKERERKEQEENKEKVDSIQKKYDELKERKDENE